MESSALAVNRISSRLVIGQIIDVELMLPDKTRFQTPLIGFKDGRYLVLAQPSVARYGLLRDNIVDNQQLVVRTICEKTTGECLGFKSSVFSKLNMPDRLLFITYPRQAEVFELRREKRLIVRQEALVSGPDGQQQVEGLMVDLSAGGCRVELPLEKAGCCGDGKLRIEFRHPVNGESQQRLARVCSRQKSAATLSLGFAFED